MNTGLIVISVILAVTAVVSLFATCIQAYSAHKAVAIDPNDKKGKRKYRNLLFTFLILALISGTASGIAYFNSQNISQTNVNSTPQTARTTTPQPTPIETASATRILEVTPTATSLPTGFANCSGGKNVGWDKWVVNPEDAWLNNGTSILNKEDSTRSIAPSITGPACGLLKRGSRISITFTMQGNEGNLYLLIQGTDNGWYGIQFNYGGPSTVKNSKIHSFAIHSTLTQGSTYTYTLELATDGTMNLLDGNTKVLTDDAVFVPNGYWGLKTFYGTFAIHSLSVN